MTSDWLAALQRLVASPTVSGTPTTEVMAFLAERHEAQGFRVERFEVDGDKANLVCTAGPEGPGGLVISGHLDVVPVAGQPWTRDPFRAEIVDGRVYGRGTTDMKGFVAAVLAGLGQVSLPKLTAPLALVWTCEEEVGCQGSGRLAAAWPRERPLPSACWIGEPTDFVPMRMHSGHVAVHILVVGEAAHTSRPQLGRNAIETAADVVQIVRALADELRDQPRSELPMPEPWVPLVVARIHGGTAINIVPDHVAIDVGYRPLPGDDPLEVFRRLQARLAAALGPRIVDVHAHVGTLTPALLTPSGTELSARLAPYAEPGPEVAPFATDGGHLATLGTQPIVMGPGSIDRAHKADEYVDAHALDRTVQLVSHLLAPR